MGATDAGIAADAFQIRALEGLRPARHRDHARRVVRSASIYERFENGVASILSDAEINLEQPDRLVILGWIYPLQRRVITVFSSWLAKARQLLPPPPVINAVDSGAELFNDFVGFKRENSEYTTQEWLRKGRRGKLTHTIVDSSYFQLVEGFQRPRNASDRILQLLRWRPHPWKAAPFVPVDGSVRLPAPKAETELFAMCWQWLLGAQPTSGSPELPTTHPVEHNGSLLGCLRLQGAPLSERALSQTLACLGAFLSGLNEEVGTRALALINVESRLDRFVRAIPAFASGMPIDAKGRPSMACSWSSPNGVVNHRWTATHQHERDAVDPHYDPYDERPWSFAPWEGWPDDAHTGGEAAPADNEQGRSVSTYVYQFDKLAIAVKKRLTVRDREGISRCWNAAEHVVESPPSAARSISWRDVQTVVGPASGDVMIVGGSGTGKERLAREVHKSSGRGGEFVALNCAGMVDQLAIADLLGHIQGAFSDAKSPRLGAILAAAGAIARPEARGKSSHSVSQRFARYAGLKKVGQEYQLESPKPGTLFLDEIANLPMSAQGALLRALDGYGFTPIGWDLAEPIRVTFRLVAATRDVKRLLDPNAFRQDLRARLDTWVLRTTDAVSEDVPTALAAAQLRLEQLNASINAVPVEFSIEAFNWLSDEIRAGGFDGLEGGNLRGVRAAVERAWTRMRGHARGALVDADTMAWACAATWRLAELPVESPSVMVQEAVDIVDMPNGIIGKAGEVVELVFDIFGRDSEVAGQVVRNALALKNPNKPNGILEDLLPTPNLETLSPEEAHKRSLLTRLRNGGTSISNRGRVSELYTKRHKEVDDLAINLGLDVPKSIGKRKASRTKKTPE